MPRLFWILLLVGIVFALLYYGGIVIVGYHIVQWLLEVLRANGVKGV